MLRAITHTISALTVVISTAAVCATLWGAPAAAAGGGGGGMSGGGSMGPSADPAKSYQEGMEAFKASDYKTAIKRFKEVLEAAPTDANTNYLLGLSYIGAGDPKNARRPLERAVRDDDAVPADAFLQLGLVYLQLDDKDKAVKQQDALADLVTKCDSKCGDGRRKELQTALDSLKSAIEKGPAKPTTGWNFPDPGEGRTLYATAVGLINHHHYVEALDKLREAAVVTGPHPDILNYMGFANRHLHNYDAAIGYYQQALAIDPQHIGATEYLGELYLEIGRIDDAQHQLARLDQLCPYGCAAREELARWMTAAR